MFLPIEKIKSLEELIRKIRCYRSFVTDEGSASKLEGVDTRGRASCNSGEKRRNCRE